MYSRVDVEKGSCCFEYVVIVKGGVLLVEGECARVDVEKGSERVCFVCLFRVLVIHHHSHASFGYPPSPTQECMRIRMYDANSESIHYPCMRTDALSVHCTALMHCTLCIRCHALYEYVTHYPWVTTLT